MPQKGKACCVYPNIYMQKHDHYLDLKSHQYGISLVIFETRPFLILYWICEMRLYTYTYNVKNPILNKCETDRLLFSLLVTQYIIRGVAARSVLSFLCVDMVLKAGG